MQKRVTSTGIEHGLLTTLINQVPRKNRFRNVEAKKKEELEKLVKRNSELVKARYIHYKNQKRGSRVVDYTAAAGEPYYVFKFLHDNVYEIPRGVVDVVNHERNKRPVRADSLDDDGKPREKDGYAERIDEFVAVAI
jgi:hypothetical protein